jgi:hypothetical protein
MILAGTHQSFAYQIPDFQATGKVSAAGGNLRQSPFFSIPSRARIIQGKLGTPKTPPRPALIQRDPV